MTSDSIKLNLLCLPTETLEQIASYLSDSHRPSLFAFGLTSKICHSATVPSNFHHIRLQVSDREVLLRDVEALIQSLARTKSARHIRCLSIKGHLRLSLKPRVEGYKSDNWGPNRWYRKIGIDEILRDEEQFDSHPHVMYDESVITRASEEDLAWLPVADLIKILPHLTKLVYDCQNQFPPSLLDALHDFQPQCRLYHLTFRLRTLLWGGPYPYEMALATSPCLYSIKVACSVRDSEGDDDFNQEAMMELVAGLAPNLKEVVIRNLCPENSWRYYRRPRGSWKGLPGFKPGSLTGSLTSLSLLGNIDLLRLDVKILPRLHGWAKHTDFSRLRHLSLGGGYGCEEIGMANDAVEWITKTSPFPQVKTLQVRLARNDYNVDNPDYCINAIAFLTSFQPLEQLSVFGPLEPEILGGILIRHGQTLTKLNLRPHESVFFADHSRLRLEVPMAFNKDHVLQIAAQCPLLEELTVSIKRTKSSSLEAEIYKSFGKMGRLKSLFLLLDCSDWSVGRDLPGPAASFDTLDHEDLDSQPHPYLKKGHLRETLLNCAVDETLARSIWKTISVHQASQKLECLKMWTCGGGYFGGNISGYMADVVLNLSRSWLIERVHRDDGDIVTVTELGRRARESRDQELTELYERVAYDKRSKEGGVNDVYDRAERREEVRIFRRIWPRKEGNEDWRNDWSSLPLQV